MTLKNIKDNAIITVSARQTSQASSEEMEFITSGCYYMRGSKHYVFYTENEDMGMSGSTVMLIAEKDHVTMRRKGEFEVVLDYCRGKSQSVVYYMPFGAVNMTQTTHSVKCDLSDSGGEIKLEYTLVMGVDEQLNELTIKIKRQ